MRFEPRFVVDAGASAAELKTTEQRNAAMGCIGSHLESLTGEQGHGIDQLDNPRRYASPVQNCNATLTSWSSGWSAATLEEMPVIWTFAESYLRFP